MRRSKFEIKAEILVVLEKHCFSLATEENGQFLVEICEF